MSTSPLYLFLVMPLSKWRCVYFSFFFFLLLLHVLSFIRLYKPVQTVSPEETPTRDFLKLDFRNKGLDAVSISNILNHKKVTSTIPAYFKNQSPPIISYSYSSPIAPKIFNYKNVLQGLNTENITRNSSACSCKASEFCYNPAGHVITGDLNIVKISKLRDILSKGPKYR